MDVTVDTPTSDIPTMFLGEDRHFIKKREHSQRRRTFNHRLRAAAKQYRAEHPDQLPCKSIGFASREECQDTQRAQQDIKDPARLRHHVEADLRWKHRQEESLPRRSKRSRPNTNLNHESSIELARSKIELPSDRKLQRCPSLERQDAFCDARTKSRVQVKQMAAGPSEDDAQVAELYRMGLLYDEQDSQAQAQTDSDIELNDIQHGAPAYSIRPARRRSHKSRNGDHQYNEGLPLNLSFADLGADNDLAPYLASQEDNTCSASSQSFAHSRRASQQAPLRVIYELATSRPSFDVDTSQPPDLMNDSLSDYDCFTDSELDDSPSQREVQDPAGPWVLLGDDD
ncbi:uncharacterized protein J7T54_001851 [Emericellopsis cladophorae]|uniref:Uncharacterized protein n=1 Tax=Emericellopsis cladophorae TaxID=2686198 RepID=A0A9P9Y6J8_9HYPO|nr:uncharacterized protein J7T54_001851 [Emericellopsis cladophorae]KAI6783975.1 hypothetical protein J7T54_001851 [Emericellopsis cladophorae]